MYEKRKNNVCLLFYIIVDYDYDFYGYSDYRGGYSEPYYDDYYRSYDGDYFFDYPPSGVNPAAGGPQRPSRNNSVGSVCWKIQTKLTNYSFFIILLLLFI